MDDVLTGFLALQGWHGFSLQEVEIIGETPKRYRIKAIKKTKLAGRRWLNLGETTLVPKYAIRDHCQECRGVKQGVPGNENVIGNRVFCDYCAAQRKDDSQ